MQSSVTDHLHETLSICGADFSDSSHVAIDAGALGEMHIEEAGEEIIICLARPFQPGADRLSVLTEALRRAHPDNITTAPLQIGTREDKLVLAARLPLRETQRRDIDEMAEHLMDMQDDLMGRP